MWSHTAFHATKLLHLAAGTGAVIIPQALQRRAARFIFQNFIFNVKNHLFHCMS
jgi:hypothetical protein